MGIEGAKQLWHVCWEVLQEIEPVRDRHGCVLAVRRSSKEVPGGPRGTCFRHEGRVGVEVHVVAVVG